MKTLNELSLFTGAGGGLLGTKLLGWKAIGYVEKETYCQKVIRQRIADGILDAAPIFGDIRKFISDGYAASYTGLVDVVTAGFPCQPFSVAGKRKGADDERNMCPATIETIRIVRPRFAFMENVPGLLSSGYFGTVLRDLHEAGYDARWMVLGADDCGAPHRRKRLWILAYTDAPGGYFWPRISMQQRAGLPNINWSGGSSANEGRSDVANATERQDNGRKRGNVDEAAEGRESFDAALDACGEDMADPKGITERPGLCHNEPGRIRRRRSGDGSGERDWWATEPDVGRVAHGVASRVDRLKALGNGQVPQVVACAWRTLMDT